MWTDTITEPEIISESDNDKNASLWAICNLRVAWILSESVNSLEERFLWVIFSDEFVKNLHSWRITLPWKRLRDLGFSTKDISDLGFAYRKSSAFITFIHSAWFIEEYITYSQINESNIDSITMVINVEAYEYKKDIGFPGILFIGSKATLDKHVEDLKKSGTKDNIEWINSMHTAILSIFGKEPKIVKSIRAYNLNKKSLQ